MSLFHLYYRNMYFYPPSTFKCLWSIKLSISNKSNYDHFSMFLLSKAPAQQTLRNRKGWWYVLVFNDVQRKIFICFFLCWTHSIMQFVKIISKGFQKFWQALPSFICTVEEIYLLFSVIDPLNDINVCESIEIMCTSCIQWQKELSSTLINEAVRKQVSSMDVKHTERDKDFLHRCNQNSQPGARVVSRGKSIRWIKADHLQGWIHFEWKYKVR